MTQVSKQSLIDASVLAWIIDGRFVTENRKPIEFVKHRFFIDYLADNHTDKVSCKCSQVGATVLEAIDDFHLAGKKGMNVIHTLHTGEVIKGLVTPKINPLIEYNPEIKKMLKVDSESLKQFKDNYVYYRGANAESQAISISADVLKIDELDRSDPVVAEMFLSRLDASEFKWLRRFSNPSAVGFGVDALFKDSTQFHWFVKCRHCGHNWYIDFEYREAEKNHYVHKEQGIYACGKCHKELTDNDRISGQWVAKYPSRDHRHGYWFSQMMAPWFSAREIMQKYRDTSIDYFYNFVLGKAYTPSDLIVDRDTILKATSPSMISKTNCALGVDNGVVKTWVLGNANGIFAHGKTESWDDIEKLILMYDPYVVIDPNPYPTTPKTLVDKYKGRVFICYFKESKSSRIVEWGQKDRRGVVYADRTRAIDVVANEIVSRDIIFRETPYQLEDYIEQWGNIYRTTVEEDDGRSVSKWLKKEGKLNDYALATTYWRIALSKIIGTFGESRMVEPDLPSKQRADVVEDGQLVTDLGARISEAMAGNDTTDWKYQ